MKALICRAWGDLDSLAPGELPAPQPGPGELVIDVACSSTTGPMLAPGSWTGMGSRWAVLSMAARAPS